VSLDFLLVTPTPPEHWPEERRMVRRIVIEDDEMPEPGTFARRTVVRINRAAYAERALKRQGLIEQELRKGGRRTARGLADLLQIDPETVFRDIVQMVERGLPVRSKRGVGYWLDLGA
jgi:DNA-binding transcriptional regulator YhcF (GntR family)